MRAGMADRSSSSSGSTSRPTAGPRRSAGTDLLVAALLLGAIGASVGLAVVYIRGGQVQLEGLFLAAALSLLAVAVGVWAKRFLPQGPVVEDRPVLESSVEDRAAVVAELDRGERSVTRRRVLATLLVGAVGSLGAALVLPFRSIGSFPLPSLGGTAWRPGSRVVDGDGRPVRVGDLEVEGLLTVFPEGDLTAAERASSQTVLIRLGPGTALAGGRPEWTPEGNIAFSKVCTHAGCSVGLYQSETHQLVCPCHQSLFDVVAGGEPVFGPAARPLPQLPLTVKDGFLVASDGYQEPIGPSFWTRGNGS